MSPPSRPKREKKKTALVRKRAEIGIFRHVENVRIAADDAADTRAPRLDACAVSAAADRVAHRPSELSQLTSGTVRCVG